MENKDLLKYGLIIGGGGLAAWGLAKLIKTQKSAKKLSLSITKFDIAFKGTEYIRFILDIDFINPSGQTISLTIPSIKPYYNKHELGYSVPMQNTHHIAPNSIHKISSLEIRIPFQKLIGAELINDAIQALTNKTAFIESLKQKTSFNISVIINGIEINIQQKFGQQAQTLGYIDESNPLFQGLGLVAAGKRNIKDGSQYNHLFPEPKGSTKLVQKDGNVEDTVIWCGKVVKQYHKDTQKLADYLSGISSNSIQLFKNIFDFCYTHIQYHLDREGVEQLRRPAVTWQDRKHGVDCDDFTMFIASILYNLEKPFQFRITKYGKPHYQHIYLIVPMNDGTHITIDPVLDTFNYEKPYTQKKDFNMKALNLAGTQEQVGIPIEILAGANEDNDLLKIILGDDLKNTINGLGSTQDDSTSMLRYLKRLRNVYVKSPDYISEIQDPKQAVQMLDYAIKYWNTPKRDEAIQKLIQIEDQLIDKGQIRLDGIDDDWDDDEDMNGLENPDEEDDDEWEEDIEFSGVESELAGYEYRYEEPEWEEDFGYTGSEAEENEFDYDYSFDGLNGRWRRRRKARKAKRRARRKARRTKRKARRKKRGGLFKKIGRGIKKGFKKVAKSIVRLNSAPIRMSFLAAMRSNMGKVADKLKYAYLTEQQAIAKGIEKSQYQKLKKAHAKVEKLFKKMGGRTSALKKAILSGKRKHLRGFEHQFGGIAGIHELDGYVQDTGYLGGIHNEEENPGYQYKYDSQVWETDPDFSGVEPENKAFEYDYSFNGLNGRALRFRRRKRAKYRYRRKKNYINQVVRNARLQQIFKQIQSWLKDIDYLKLVEKHHRKQSFLNSISLNYHDISTILSYGYLNQLQAQEQGVHTSQWKQIREALQKTEKLFNLELGGQAKELEKAIFLGKDKPALEGLGAITAVIGGIASLIGKIIGWIKNIKIKRKAKKEAKQKFKESGGTNQQWREEGKEAFKEQWQKQVEKQQQQAQAIPGNTNLPQASNSLTVPHAATPGINPQIPVQAINTGGQQANSIKENIFKNFLKKNKNLLLIGGGIIGAGTLAYFTLRPKKKKPVRRKAAPKKAGVAGVKNTRTKKSTGTKIKEVKLS